MFNISDALIDQIWEKAKIVDGYDSTRWRKDFAGAWIKKDQYGIQSIYGWEIDHLKPVKLGGRDDISNLNPLHWENNRAKSSNYPRFRTVISSEGNRNVNAEKLWQIS